MTVQIDSVALANLLRSESGPVMRNMAERGSVVQRLAKQKVGYSEHSTTGQHLRDEIVKRFVQTDSGPAVAVGIFGKDALRAIFHHEGTRPHVIRPRKRKYLAFYWPGHSSRFAHRISDRAGYVFLKEVHHPGTASVPFLRDALYEGFNSVGSVV